MIGVLLVLCLQHGPHVVCIAGEVGGSSGSLECGGEIRVGDEYDGEGIRLLLPFVHLLCLFVLYWPHYRGTHSCDAELPTAHVFAIKDSQFLCLIAKKTNM